MRGSGVLMHISSLPGPYGIGTLGKEAYGFVDFLKQAGQTHWQMLPLNPTGYGDSPYQSCSTFAGNHYLIDFNMLADRGLLHPEELAERRWQSREDCVDFGLQYENRLAVLRLAFSRFQDREALELWCRENSAWLTDYALFMALKDSQGGKPWYQWPEGLKKREATAVWNARQELAEEIRFYSFTQFLFYRQWTALRDYATKNGIRIIGDVPIYVPLDSVEVWCSPELFQLDKSLRPTAVAGCPPDAFSRDGQLWGNPLYRWQDMKKNGYRWWIRRLEAAGKMFDVVRLDHFRGFEAYWSVPFGAETAREGTWKKGPGKDFFVKLKKALPELQLIAEDLGFLTQEVLDLRDGAGLPGMKVLQFAFDSREPSAYLPHKYVENTVCYTGTHDNMTTRQWFETASPEVLNYAKAYMALTEEEGFVWGTVRTAMASVSRLCIVPMQDYLNLGGEARMNLPGSKGNNWTWRMKKGSLTENLAKIMNDMVCLYDRKS